MTTDKISKRIVFPMRVGTCHCDVVSLTTDCTVLKPDIISGAGLDKWLPV